MALRLDAVTYVRKVTIDRFQVLLFDYCRSNDLPVIVDCFFQAEDGIRDIGVTGVQTCALPIFPLYRDPRSDMPVTQFDMKYVEAAGLVKFDFLGLKTLSVLQKAVQMLARRGIEVDQIGRASCREECRSRWSPYH